MDSTEPTTLTYDDILHYLHVRMNERGTLERTKQTVPTSTLKSQGQPHQGQPHQGQQRQQYQQPQNHIQPTKQIPLTKEEYERKKQEQWEASKVKSKKLFLYDSHQFIENVQTSGGKKMNQLFLLKR
jgi:hypothetical protein